MTASRAHILLAVCLIGLALAGYDLVTALRTGTARGRWGSPIAREGRPVAFRRWVIGQIVVVALLLAGVVWGVSVVAR